MMQGSPEWFASRVGCATASRFADILARIKSGEAAARRNYRAALVAERLTGVPYETYQSAEMKFGIEQEPIARIAYEVATGNFVEEVGFFRHAELMAGASPDGRLEGNGGLEIKCPNTATHIETILKGMSAEHIPQVQGQMWICGFDFVEFLSFDGRLPDKLQLYIQRIPRDPKYITELELAVRLFLGEVDDLEAELRRKAA